MKLFKKKLIKKLQIMIFCKPKKCSLMHHHSLKKLSILEKFSINIIQEEIKLFLIIGCLNGQVT